MLSLDRPLSSELRVADALQAYLDENGFDKAHYDATHTPASVLGIAFGVPNTPSHRLAIMRHDLHHVATGYGTDLAGEAEISAWEVRRGFGDLGLYVGAIVSSGVVLGLLAWPRRTIRAARAPGRRNFFGKELRYEDLLAMTVGELRDVLGVPREGIAGARKLHAGAPKSAGAKANAA